MAWEKIEKRGTNQNNRRADYFLMVSEHKPRTLCVTLSDKAMRRMKWKIHDKVDLLFDRENKLVGLQRTTEQDARPITTNGRQSGGRKVRAVVKAKLESEDLRCCVNGTARRLGESDVIIDDDQDVIAFGMRGSN